MKNIRFGSYASLLDPFYIRKDGVNSPTSNIDWGAYKITNLANPENDQDAATKYYVDQAMTESDPVFTSWDKSTGISITESQISDFGTYLTSETDPIWTSEKGNYQVTSEKGQNNGYASLDAGGKVPVSELPNSIVEYKGTWNASTNTPTLIDGTGNAGDVYIVSVAGTQNLGSGNISFLEGDWVMYNGTIWQKSINSNAVVSVNTQTGVVTLDADDIDDTSTANKFVTSTDITNLSNLSGINSGDQESSDFNLTSLGDVDDTDKAEGKILQVDSAGNHVYVTNAGGSDEKVKYDSNDTTAGYLSDKIIAGDGISLSEGTGTDENKLVITNTGDQTSIKKTFTSQKTWHTGDSVFLKLTYAMLGDPRFWRVYENNVLLEYETDWEFNDTGGFKIGCVAGLVDGVKFLNPQDGATYRFEYDEYQMSYSPMLALYRDDGLMPMKGMPPNRITGEGNTGPLVSIVRAGDEFVNLNYTLSFDNGGAGFTKAWYYANRLCIPQFPRGQAFPTGWRMEVYKQGRHWSQRRKKATGTYNTTMNSVLSPRIVYTTNEANIMWMIEKKRTGVFYVRMRNTTTNEVSQFSFQSICTRKFFYSNGGYTAGKGGFFKVSLR